MRSKKYVETVVDYGGELNRDMVIHFLKRESAFQANHGYVMIYDWLLSGAKTAFLQDANTLILRTEKLMDILRHHRKTFPSLRRVTSYARSKTLSQKKPAELLAIRKTGLDRLHVDPKSGDDNVLNIIKKASHVRNMSGAGKKPERRGFSCPNTGCRNWVVEKDP